MSCSIAHAEPNIRRDRWSDMRRANISQHSRDNDPLAEELNRSPGLAREYPAVQWTLSSRLKKPRNPVKFFFRNHGSENYEEWTHQTRSGR